MKNNPFNFCQNCSGHRCCGILKKEDAPYLTTHDIKLLKTIPNFKTSNFINKNIHPVIGKTFYSLSIKNKLCGFFNQKTGRCNIYQYRPLDCRLFPLSIHKENNKYFLILYNHCQLNKKQIQQLIEYAESEILPILRLSKLDLENYATLPIDSSWAGWQKIKEIRP